MIAGRVLQVAQSPMDACPTPQVQAALDRLDITPGMVNSIRMKAENLLEKLNAASQSQA